MEEMPISTLATPNAAWREVFSSSMNKENYSNGLHQILEKLCNGEKLSEDDGLYLHNQTSLNELGSLANEIKSAMFGPNVFFNSNVHINQTNICVLACKFCAFRRGSKAKDAYEYTIESFIEELSLYSELVNEVHTVGGLHPDWTVEYYENLFSTVRQMFPHISIKSLSAVEIKHLAQQSNLDVKTILTKLRDSGLTSLPGGGAEILDDDVRSIICNGKESSQEYLDIHRQAHELGIPTNCTMLFGTVETPLQRIQHLIKLRTLQDDTLGFQCFVPYPFLKDNTRLPEAQLATGQEILKIISISRIMLTNIPHIKAYRMNIGDHLAELALQFGADDIDGIVQKESIMHSAGSTAQLDLDNNMLAKLIENSGSIPVLRNTTYNRAQFYVKKEIPRRRTLPVVNG
jgi:aminodeoxyfutalosine synthase